MRATYLTVHRLHREAIALKSAIVCGVLLLKAHILDVVARELADRCNHLSSEAIAMCNRYSAVFSNYNPHGCVFWPPDKAILGK